jgi:hypothetical protein
MHFEPTWKELRKNVCENNNGERPLTSSYSNNADTISFIIAKYATKILAPFNWLRTWPDANDDKSLVSVKSM